MKDKGFCPVFFIACFLKTNLDRFIAPETNCIQENRWRLRLHIRIAHLNILD